MILETLPQRLKNLRETSGMNQGELARVAGITQAQVSNYEVGKQFPGLETAMRLASAFGITVADLIGEKEPATAPPRPPTRNEMALWVIEAIGIEGFQLDRIREVLRDRPYKY